MDINKRAQRAVEKKMIYGLNCCQAVALELQDQTDLDEITIKNLASGFAVGMGNMQATCGALIGANMIAGLSAEGSGAVRNAKAISDEFKNLCGATICKDLKGVETGKVLCPCNDCVKNAVIAYGKVMGLKNKVLD